MIRQPPILTFLYFIAAFMVSPIFASDSPDSPRSKIRMGFDGDFPLNGNLQLDIFQPLEGSYRGTLIFQTNIPAAQAAGGMAIPDLPEGNYTLRLLHDANEDGRMNSNAFGVPTESVLREPFTVPASTLRVTLAKPPADSRAWGAGVMTLFSSNPYRGGKAVWRALPLLTYVGESLYVIGPRAGFNLVKKRFVSANLTARYDFAGDAFDDSPYLEGMTKRRDTLSAGIDATLRGFGAWQLAGDLLTDVMGRHDGQEINVSLSRTYRGQRGALTPGLGLVWHSSTYNDYYYGVRSNEVSADRPAYAPGASVEWFASLFGRYEINNRWSLLGSYRLEWLSDEIRDSPIVDATRVHAIFLGINYAF